MEDIKTSIPDVNPFEIEIHHLGTNLKSGYICSKINKIASNLIRIHNELYQNKVLTFFERKDIPYGLHIIDLKN